MPRSDRLIRLASTLAVIALASISFLVSFQHCYALALYLGESQSTALLLPITVDLLWVVAAMTGLFCSRYQLPQPRLARVALLMGIAATLAVNVAHGLLTSVWAALFGAWPAIALVTSTELVLWVIATARSMDHRQTIVVEHTEPVEGRPREQLAQAVELLTIEPGISAAEVGRRLDMKYVKALKMTKQARELLAAERS